jgi:hypothetical protein
MRKLKKVNLELRTETVRDLSERQLSGVAGGGGTVTQQTTVNNETAGCKFTYKPAG